MSLRDEAAGDAALKTIPRDVLVGLGAEVLECLERGETEKAKAHLRALSETQSITPALMVVYAVCLGELGDPERADRICKLVESLDSLSPENKELCEQAKTPKLRSVSWRGRPAKLRSDRIDSVSQKSDADEA